MKYLKAIVLATLAMTAINCGSNGSNNNQTPYYANGACYGGTGAVSPYGGTTVGCNSAYGVNGYSGYGQQCIGYYYSTSYGWVTCNGSNCRGYTLYNQSGQPVVCQ